MFSAAITAAGKGDPVLNENAMQWLDSRKIDVELADRLGLETVARGNGEWIAIPYLRDGKRVNRKYRRIDQKGFSQDSQVDGAVKCVWNEDVLRDRTLDGPVIITEGEFDAIAAIQCGFARTVSVPDGAPAEVIGNAETAKYSYVEALLDLLHGCNEIIIAADGDAAGANLLEDLAIRLGKARCKFLKYPQECKDLNDALIRYGEKGVIKTIERAQFFEMKGLHKFSDLSPTPPLNVYRAGLSEDFDRHVGICKKHVSVWTGIPNHGKSTIINAVAFEMVRQNNWRIAMCSFEAEPNPQGPLHRDAAKYLAQKPIREVGAEDMDRAGEFLDKNFVFIVPDLSGEAITLDWLIENAQAAVLRHGADMLIVDPWSKLDHEYGSLSENDYTSVCLKTFQKFARRFNVHVAIVAHPKKIEIQSGKFRVPTGYDISGSAHWFNHPELGVTVHRDVDKGHGVALVRVWKSKRHDEMGPTGDVRLRIFPSGRFEEWFDENQEAA